MSSSFWVCPLFQDDLGQLSYDGLTQVHWVSFLDGRQRVLLFTEDLAVVTKARQAEDLEQFQQEVKVSLRNLGLSLINNRRRQEIAYIGITRSLAQTSTVIQIKQSHVTLFCLLAAFQVSGFDLRVTF